MSNPNKTRAYLETSALVIVVVVPLVAIGWYVLGGNTAPAAAPAPVVPAAQATVAAQQQSVTPTDGTGTVTLDDPSALPSSVTTAEIVPFSFTIQNTGSATGVFPYKVYVEWNSGEQDVIDENSITLAAGATTDISESLKFETATAKGQVYIELQPSGPATRFAIPRS